MEELLLLLLILAIGVSWLVRAPRSPISKGAMGERAVQGALADLESAYPKSLHDVVLQTPDGTTQIDHVLVSAYGVFSIETKNYKGWIFGDSHSKNWMQSLYGKRFKFQNPLRQNYKHVKALQNFLQLNQKQIHSVVVFVGKSKFKTVMPENVVALNGLLPFIRSYRERVLDDNDVNSLIEKLRDSQKPGVNAGSSHVQNLKRNRENPICPRCGKEMVLRTARKGRNAGGTFWGCSGFPSCKSLKDVA
jgi:restriction system protein